MSTINAVGVMWLLLILVYFAETMPHYVEALPCWNCKGSSLPSPQSLLVHGSSSFVCGWHCPWSQSVQPTRDWVALCLGLFWKEYWNGSHKINIQRWIKQFPLFSGYEISRFWYGRSITQDNWPEGGVERMLYILLLKESSGNYTRSKIIYLEQNHCFK